jgi:hypothetical protein
MFGDGGEPSVSGKVQRRLDKVASNFSALSERDKEIVEKTDAGNVMHQGISLTFGNG